MFETGLQSASEDKSYQRSVEQRKKHVLTSRLLSIVLSYQYHFDFV